MRRKFWYFNLKVIRQISLMTLFFILPFTLLKSQTYFFEKYGVEQGFSSKIYSIIQDKNDQIWLGTESGVSRFSGSKPDNFSFVDGMATGGVRSLLEDTTGRIWFGHLNGGLSYFDGIRFIKTRFDSLNIESDITSIKQIGKFIWITTFANGAIRMTMPGREDSVLIGKQYLGIAGLSDQVSSSCVDSKGDLYCIADAGIKKYNPEKDVFETFSPPGLTKFFNTVVMYEDKKGNYWFGTHHGGLYKYEKSSGTMKVYDQRDVLSGNLVTSITEDYKGDVWVGTWEDDYGGGGITVFSGEKTKKYNNLNGLEAHNIHCLLEDREKNMLIADHNNGLTIYKGDHFVTFSDKSFLPDKGVFAVDEDELGRYWFGTNEGISVYDPNIQGKDKVKFYNRSKNAIGNKVTFIKSDHNGNVWIGTNGTGLFRYEMKTGRFIYDININGYLHSNKIITALALDKNNKLWIGNMDRLVVWDGAKEEVKYYTQEDGLAGNGITAIFCDKNDNIWIGSDYKPGLTKYNTKTGKFTIVNIGEGFTPTAISQTPDSRIWIGTTSGLLVLKDDSVVQHLNEENGLLTNIVKLLQPDGNNFLYIGTTYGLNRYNLTDGTIATFTKRNGFAGVEANYNASLSDTHGTLWFGTANGVTRLSTKQMPPVSTEPMTHISSMSVNQVTREMKAGLKLSFKEKSITFNYYSVCLANADAVKYKVILSGPAKADWSPVNGQTFYPFSSLSPGHYTFKVMASNSYGYWNEAPVEYSFTIKPPFYFSPLFIAICLIALAVAIISYIKIRESNLIKEKKILETKVEERTAEVVQKSAEIEQKNRDITASIRYAERIQRAMLPREDTFKDTFVLFLPKDIVSGDFYWMYDTGDIELIAAVDCTGHGVPGAFMSIIGHNSLNKIVREYGIIRPSAILDQLNTEVTKALLQRDEKAITDGMDLALIAFNRNKFTCDFAGAYNPLYVVRKGEIFVYKGDKFPIGMTKMEVKKSFVNQPVNIQPGDMLYMCSDGYPDQFGHEDGKKLKTVNVKKILSEIWHLPVHEQKEKLEKMILDWKGELQQVDDILFIGTKIPEN